MTTSDNNKDDQENNISNDDHDGCRRRRRPSVLPETKEVNNINNNNNNNSFIDNHKNDHNTRTRTRTTPTPVNKKKKMKKPTAVAATPSRNRILRLVLQGTIHLICIGLYLIPILTPNEFAGPTLDEAHVMSGDVQLDIHDPDASWKQIFSNDYWGRPMNSPSSHKSWRPLTILTFRYLKGPYIDLATQSIQQLTVHRFVNAILHATVGDLVGQLATQLSLIEIVTSSRQIISQQHQLLGLQLITKVLFCLHPTHVEVTANAANRNHLLAVLFGVILCFPGRRATSSIRSAGALMSTPIITTPFWLFLIAMIMGYLASETFLFMIPGVMVTMTVIAFTTNTNTNINTIRVNQNQNDKHNQTGTTLTSDTRNGSADEGVDNDKEDDDNVHASSSSQTNSNDNDTDNDNEDNDNDDDDTLVGTLVFSPKRFIYDYLRAILSIAPRLILVAASVFIYYCARWYYDTLDIPTGLIRPAESPYYEFTGIHRIRNYLYVVTIHLGKQWGSILPKQFGGDPIGFSHEYGYDCVPEIKQWGDVRLVFGVGFHIVFAILLSLALVIYNPRKFFGLVAIHWSWTLGTLFPIFGIVKVGTFISDRIVVPSTVVVSIWMGKLVYTYATDWIRNKRLPFVYFRPLQFVFIFWWTITSYLTVHNRSLDWMDSISLMKSSLITCPRFAKVHMEVSKIYSGLYPTMFNLKTSRFHLDTAREIDPNLCDLHKQYVYVALQENKYLEVEQELPQALLCSYTAGGTEQLWNNYWNQLLSAAPKGTRQHADIETRYKNALSIVQTGIQKERDREREQQYYNDMVE